MIVLIYILFVLILVLLSDITINSFHQKNHNYYHHLQQNNKLEDSNSLSLTSSIIQKIKDNDFNLHNSTFRDPSCYKKETLFYITTIEGMMSHHHQINDMWMTAQSLNRCLSLFAFHSHHYLIGNISFCDYFNLPDDINCLPWEYHYYVPNSLHCVAHYVTGGCKKIVEELKNQTKYDLGWTNKAQVTIGIRKTFQKFDFNSTNCFCGYYDQSNPGIHPPLLKELNYSSISPYSIFNHTQIFSNQMQNKFVNFIKVLNFTNSNYIVIHW